ncbi:MAG: potassium channel family protein, partial [Acidaminococcaceae bacterium]
PVNRVDGYVDCLYFSGISILTIGYGDIVPVANITKLMVILEGFLGQLINVVAIGLWLSSIDNKP